MRKKFLAGLMALVMLLSLVPMTAFAAEGVEAYAELLDAEGLETSKVVEVKPDGTFDITLEAYATGTVSVTTETKDVPLDIVLVLDQSGSMAYDFNGDSTNTNESRRQYAMKAAVNNFIAQVADKYDAEKSDHRMAIVTFGSNASTLQGWTYVDASGEATLTGKVTALPNSPSGATNVAAGMTQAQTLHNDNSYDGTNTERQKIVIVFTDGVPTTSTDFSTTVATNAIATAKEMKDDGVTIYTIGIFNGVDATQLHGEKWDYTLNSDIACSGEVGSYWGGSWVSELVGSNDFNGVDIAAGNRFLNFLSSNFKSAIMIGLNRGTYNPGNYNYAGGTGYQITKNFNRDSSDYYLTATDAESLNNVFTSISSSLETSTSTTTLNSEAVMRDIVADSFQLPEDVEVDDYIKNHITVQTVDYLGNDQFATTPATLDSAVVTVNNDKTIDVKGFDFSTEYCVDTTPVKGKKLIIKIEGLELDPDNYVDGQVYTNGRGSGVYDQDGNLVEEFPRPSVMLGKHSYVVDYAKSFDMHANEFNQDDGFDHLAVDPTNFETPNLSGLDLTNGKVVVKDSEANTLTYIPQTMNWNGYDTFYVFGHNHIDDDNFDLWSQINVIPANNVYYEDDFVSTPTDTEESEAVVGITYGDGWKVEYGESGTTDGNTETVDGKVQGWEEQLSDDATFSDNAAHVAGAGATATFTFTGTGVDIYSYTDMNSGMVVGMLYEGTDTTATMTKLLMIDNFAQSGEYYQIPTLSFQDLDHGTYTVKLVVNKLKVQNEDGTIATDETGETKYRDTYYLDGIRIYNPIQNIESTDEIVQDAYIEKDEETGNITSTELNAVFTEVRDILIDATMYDSEGDNTGAVFVDQTVYNEDTDTTGASIGVYEDYGPKNEVYLAKGQHITFKVDSSDAMYQIGLKAPEGATTATWSGSSEFNYTGEINHSTDLYYKTAPAGGYITITNNGDNLLSVTKIKTTGATAESASLMLLSMTEEEAVAEVSAFSLRTAMAYDAAPEEELPESPVEPEVPEKPETPEEPTEPEVPEEPETPEEPTEPEVPDIDIEIENPEPKPEEKPVQKPNHHENLKKLVNSLFKIMSGWFGR